MNNLKETILRKILDHIRHWREPHHLPVVYVAFLALGALISLFSILRSPSESGNALFLGYSLEKTLLGAGLILLLLLFITLILKLSRQPEWSRQLWEIVFNNRPVQAIILWACVAFLFIFWIALFLPSYRLGGVAGDVVQLKAVIVWLAVVSAVTMRMILLERGKESIGSVILKNKMAVWVGTVVLALFILAGALVVFTGIGVSHPEDYWYASGVPVLGLQIIFSLVLGALFIWLEPRWNVKPSTRVDGLICLGLWVATAWLWAREPIRPNFFMPDTAGNLMYPYSDSATFDIASQFALIGQGIFNGQYFDRVLYIAFLNYLHILFGQNTTLMMTAQAVVYAVYPVLVYLLGRELHSRALGVSAGVLILLRGLNSLVSATWIDLASPKMILTDFPAAIGIAFFLLLFLKWFKDPSRKHLAVWAGAALGFTILLRTNAILLLPILLVYAWVALRPRWKYASIGSLLLVFGMLAATTPWDLRNLQNGTPMFYVYYSRIQLVLRARYGVQGDTYLPNIPSAVQVSQTQAGLRAIARQRVAEPLETKYCDTQPCKIANHFFHNLITSILFLPSSFTFDDLWNIIKLGIPYWRNDWVGAGLGVGAGIFLLLNLAVISLGFGAMWERNRVVSVIPAIVFLVYILSNALALTSGGRYIVPVDWIICVYYMAGLLQIAYWMLRFAGVVDPFENLPPSANIESAINAPKIVSAFVMIFMLGSLIPISEMPFERRYQASSVEDTLAMLEQKGMFEQANFDREELSAFLAGPRAEMFVGRLLYPRYYFAGEGELDRHYPYVPLDYPRLVFNIIGPFEGGGRQHVIIPGNNPKMILHAADVVVVGCKAEQNLDGLAVFVLSEAGFVYLRSPQSELKCPLQSPIIQP